MNIGTVRADEAKVFDGAAGYHVLGAGGDYETAIEVYWTDGSDAEWDEVPPAPGWYWRLGREGYLPNGEPEGPFSTSHRAYNDAEDAWLESYYGV